MPRSWTYLLALSIPLACNDSEPQLTGAPTGAPPGFETGPCISNVCNAGLACNGGFCVDADGGGDPSNPSGDDPTDTVGPTTGGSDTSPTGGPTGSPTGDPTGSPTSDPTADPTVSTSGPTSDSDSDSDTTPGTSGPPGRCMHLQLDPVPSRVVLVVDRSGSMSAVTWDHDANPGTAAIPRWTSVHKALTAAVNKYAGVHQLGLMMFPSSAAVADYSAAACTTNNQPEVAPAPGNAAAIAGALPPANTSLKGGTPIARGLNGGLAGQPHAMVLIGDGPPNCSIGAPDTDALFEDLDTDPQAILQTAWQGDGIPTAVVGVQISPTTSGALKDGNPDNTNAFDVFNALAVAGGRPRPGPESFYAADDEAELVTFVDQAVASVLGCELDLGNAPVDPFATVVVVGGATYPYDADLSCAGGNGWIYTGDNSTLQLCGTACAALKSGGGAQVDVDCG